MGEPMESKPVVIMALLILASAVFIPSSDADVAGQDVFTYYSLLDDNEAMIYKEVSAATSVTDESVSFKVVFKENRLFDDTDDAEAYAKQAVANALSALYLSNPMVPYVWDYPAKGTTVTPEVVTVTVSSGEDAVNTYYVVQSASFSLKVPEGITSESMDALNEAIGKVKVTGNTDADKVRSIMATLKGLSFQKDGEGEISNIYDALVTKKTTSAGVAQAFVQLCKSNSIAAISVSGDNTLAKEEKLSVWNYVYLEGDIDGTTTKSWYMVDASYASDSGICGYSTEITFDGKNYSMAGVHGTDLKYVGDNTLTVPQIAAGKYVPVGGVPFLEKYGEMILIGAMGAVIVIGMLYAVRQGNF